MPGLRDLLLIGACGPIAAIGMTMLGEAYRLEEANIVTSFEYTTLIWGTVWGYLIWNEMPGIESVIGAGLIARGPDYAGWGAGIFVLSRFLDHFDGELARIQKTSSKLGYYLDYAVGGIGYAALFAGLGLCFWDALGPWSLVLGAAGSASALI